MTIHRENLEFYIIEHGETKALQLLHITSTQADQILQGARPISSNARQISKSYLTDTPEVKYSPIDTKSRDKINKVLTLHYSRLESVLYRSKSILNAQLQLEPADVINEAVYQLLLKEQIQELPTGELLALLIGYVKMTKNKYLKSYRQRETGRRRVQDMYRETVSYNSADYSLPLDVLCDSLDETDRQILGGLMLNESQTDIAEYLGLHRVTVARRIAKLRQLLGESREEVS